MLFVRGPHQIVFKAYSWLCYGITPGGVEGLNGMLEIEPG